MYTLFMGYDQISAEFCVCFLEAFSYDEINLLLTLETASTLKKGQKKGSGRIRKELPFLKKFRGRKKTTPSLPRYTPPFAHSKCQNHAQEPIAAPMKFPLLAAAGTSVLSSALYGDVVHERGQRHHQVHHRRRATT
jgi:hypothetical protein